MGRSIWQIPENQGSKPQEFFKCGVLEIRTLSSGWSDRCKVRISKQNKLPRYVGIHDRSHLFVERITLHQRGLRNCIITNIIQPRWQQAAPDQTLPNLGYVTVIEKDHSTEEQVYIPSDTERRYERLYATHRRCNGNLKKHCC